MRGSYDYGILGVGELGAAIVTGLCQDAVAAPSILLSPRSAARATALAKRYPSVAVAPDNQALADRCAVVVLSVRPADATEVLGQLTFRAGQAVISVLAGVAHAELARLVAPAADITRAVPLPQVARRALVTPVYPDTAAAQALFSPLGGVLPVTEVSQFEAMSAATATVAAHVRYLAEISRWLSDQGVAPDQASRYVRSVFGAAGQDLAARDEDFGQLTRAFATPGGLNERFSALLAADGVFDSVRRSIDDIYGSL
jgi:pyrroline-5-carboxylate reductase